MGGVERQAKDGTIYRQVGQDSWEPITRRAKDGTVYRKVGQDEWTPEKPKAAEGGPADMFDMRPMAKFGLRMLDYPGGLVRTGAAGLMGVATKEDALNAINPLSEGAPSSAEFLERGGVSEGYAVPKNVPVIGGVSARDAGGFALDVASDPLTAVGLAGKTGKAVSKAISPMSSGMESAGKSMYKSGLKNVDKKLAEKGKAPLSDLLLEERKTGSMKKLSEASEEIGQKANVERAKLYQEASDAGAVVDMTAAVKGARAKIREMRANPGMRDVADKLEEFLNKYEGEGFADIQSVSDWKSALYDSLPDSAFSGGRIKGPAKAFEKILARDFKLAIEKAADEAAPGLGKKISEANERMATTLSARKPMTTEINKAVTPNNFTQVDAMWSALGGVGGAAAGGPIGAPLGAAAAYSVKNAAKSMNTTGGRTRGGLLLKDIGSTGLVDSTARRGLINAEDKKKDDKRRK